jgi:hypothetical protein
LGRRVKVETWGYSYEADPRHRELALEHFGFGEDTKVAGTNGDKEEKDEEWESESLNKEEAKKFRGVVARLNYLSGDCPDLQFGVKQCSREMANPTWGSWKSVKKVARYLVGRKRLVWQFKWQDYVGRAEVASDSDWGGNVKDRKSTSGGVWMLGGHCIKTWSATQGAFALSSAEAELYAMVEAVTRAKGLMSLAQELHTTLPPHCSMQTPLV